MSLRLKQCKVCGETIQPHKGQTQQYYYDLRKTCSRKCGQASRIKSRVFETGWAIVYARTKRAYVTKVYQDEGAAREALEDVLLYYPAGHQWRRMLDVAYTTVKYEPQEEKAA